MVTIVDGGDAFSTFTDTLDGGDAFTVYGPDVDIVVGAAGPTVSVGFNSLVAGAATLTLHRRYVGQDGRTVDGTVRGAVRASALGAYFVEDAEVPIGVDVEYLAEMFDADGRSLGFTASSVIHYPIVDGRTAYISDPLDATSAVRVTMLMGAAATQSMKAPGQRYTVGFRTVVLAGIRSLRTDLNMDFLTDTVEDRERIYALMQDTGGIVLIRTPAPADVPRLLYCWASDPQPTGHWTDDDDVLTAWANSVEEITPIVGDIAVARVNWQAYMDAFPTWVDMQAAYTTWYDAMRNPPGGA
ncbi:hypothetical protein NY588_09545 [Curtobacterium flaccumfaciens pv. beticola]|uniref:hypothetical protein n=1 Tax=Curtobacterium flaccumfaciens TaxID=2035 RepID=UPI00349FC746|nr:hypothetical protein [Curtobacterium flaccumfaciens pv. basellae]